MSFTVHMPAFISRLLIHFCSCNPEPGFLLLKSLLIGKQRAIQGRELLSSSSPREEISDHPQPSI